MSVWKNKGALPNHDKAPKRQNYGTVGGPHAVPSSIPARAVSSIIDDSDPRITYGAYNGGTASFTNFASEGYTQRGTQVIIGSTNDVENSAAVLTFIGTSIGVMGGTNPYSGQMSVYIDGVLTSGRLPVSVSLNIGSIANTSQPVVAIGATSVTALTIPSGFTDSGTIMLGNELLTYSSKTSTTFTLTSAVTQNHYADETVYAWGSVVDLGTATDWANKRLLYYNPFLQPGQHRIVIVVNRGTTTGKSRIYFDGFITGSLVGSSNLFTQTGTITVGPLTLDGNGHGDIGTFVSNNSDVSIIGILGYTQTSAETTNTTAFVRLGIRYQPDGSPWLYVHNGGSGQIVTLIITFMYIGESL